MLLLANNSLLATLYNLTIQLCDTKINETERFHSIEGSRWPNGKSVGLETRGNPRLWVRIPAPTGGPRLLPGRCSRLPTAPRVYTWMG